MGVLDVPSYSKSQADALFPSKTSFATDIADPASIVGNAMAVNFTVPEPPLDQARPYSAIYSNVPVLVLRYDDGRDIDLTIQALLNARDLVATFAIISDYVGQTGRVTAAQLLAAQAQGHEISCHSATHGGTPANDAAYFYETVGAAAALRGMGGSDPRRLYIQSFIQPGTWGDPSAYWMDTPAQLDTYAGKILRKNFAASMGYLTDGPALGYREIPASLKYGASHAAFETGGTAAGTVLIDKLIAQGGNLEILTHPSTIDQAGNNTMAQFTAFLDYVKTKRDAGLIRVMTATAALYCQPGTPRDLMSDNSFETYFTNPAASPWSAGVTIASGVGASGSGFSARTSSSPSQNTATIRQQYYAARQLRSVEIVGKCKPATASAATARITATRQDTANASIAGSLSKTIALGAGAGWTDVRFNVGMDTLVDRLRFDFGAATSSTDVLWDDVHAYRV